MGGNLGVSLLDVVDEIRPDDSVVLELSSFQLENLDVLRTSPTVAVVLNITPNHLDRHGTMAEYVAAKEVVVRHQGPDDVRVLNADDPLTRGFANDRTRWFGHDVADGGVRIDGESLRYDGLTMDLRGRRLPGAFNLHNMAAAAAATAGAFAGWETAAERALVSFRGVEHRLEFVAEVAGVSYYDDSIATTPERTLAALDTLPGPLVILLGGYDKGLPFDQLGHRVRERCRAAVVFGTTAEAICAAIGAGRTEDRGSETEVHRAGSLEEAVAIAASTAEHGDTVVLSPACASYGMFANFVQRGRRFKELVRALPGT